MKVFGELMFDLRKQFKPEIPAYFYTYFPLNPSVALLYESELDYELDEQPMQFKPQLT